MSVMIEGGAVSAAAVGFARLRPRRGRVRREPIDIELIAAEFAEPQRRSEQELIAALELEVQRANLARATADLPAPPLAEPVAPPDPEPSVAPRPATAVAPEPVTMPTRRPMRGVSPATVPGAPAIDLDQVRAWLEQVKEDLRRVQARVEFLQDEQSRLQGQHELVNELVSTAS